MAAFPPIGGERGTMSASADGTGLGRVASSFVGPGGSGMVNELLIQMQSLDQPPFGARLRARMIELVNAYLPVERRIPATKPSYSNILLIAALFVVGEGLARTGVAQHALSR